MYVLDIYAAVLVCMVVIVANFYNGSSILCTRK